MRLDANYNGTWRRVPVPESLAAAGDTHAAESHLMDIAAQLAPGARGLRIVGGDTAAVLWTWDAEHGWRRPHGFTNEENHL
jgi:hypothetical protein